MTTALFGLLLATQVVAAATPVESSSAPVEIVLFSDFQCPFCARFSEPFRQIQQNGVDGTKLNVQFKHFPLAIHPHAQLAHQAAAAADQQGKFWEMHDVLFANVQQVTRADLLALAKKLGLNVARFASDLDSDRVKQIIEADKAEGQRRGVTGTPTFYVNGKEYVGVRSVEQLTQIVSGEQQRARAVAEISDDMLSAGPRGAPITVELFADLQSPVSGPTVSVLKHLMKQYPSAVRLQFRNFPLAFHPQAAVAHEAAMIAAREGKFWEFADYVLAHQASLREQDLVALAGRLGLDATKFAETLQQHRYAARIDADLQRGLSRGIRGSPVVIVNGKRIDGVPSPEMLTQYVESEMKAAQSGPPQP
jgi:protein-disulfide isomerase